MGKGELCVVDKTQAEQNVSCYLVWEMAAADAQNKTSKTMSAGINEDSVCWESFGSVKIEWLLHNHMEKSFSAV